MPRLTVAVAAMALSFTGAVAQECGGGFSGAQTLQAADHTLMFRTQPAKIAVGKHFAVEIMVCGKSGSTVNTITVDAYMPEHRHGMNYKPVVQALGAGRFQADGLMFHMPGRWEFRFDVESQGRTERLSSGMVLR